MTVVDLISVPHDDAYDCDYEDYHDNILYGFHESYIKSIIDELNSKVDHSDTSFDINGYIDRCKSLYYMQVYAFDDYDMFVGFCDKYQYVHDDIFRECVLADVFNRACDNVIDIMVRRINDDFLQLPIRLFEDAGRYLTYEHIKDAFNDYKSKVEEYAYSDDNSTDDMSIYVNPNSIQESFDKVEQELSEEYDIMKTLYIDSRLTFGDNDFNVIYTVDHTDNDSVYLKRLNIDDYEPL